METGDGWLLRIRVPGGFVTPTVLETVAAVAVEFGSGIVDITSRANLQIRGVPDDVVDRAARAVVDAQLSLADARTDAFRAVVSSPLTGHDPGAWCDAQPTVNAVVARLATGIIGAVPSKFGVVIDDGGSWPLDGLDADVSVRATAVGVWSVRLRGDVEPIGLTDSPVDVVLAATQLCVDHERRLDRVVAAIGSPEVAGRLAVTLASGTDKALIAARASRGTMVGLMPHLDEDRSNIVAAPFLGRVDANTLTAIAGLAAQRCDSLRLTPDHSFAFCGVPTATSSSLLSRLRELDLVVDHDDPRAALSACVGSFGCTWARADTWLAATRLAATERSNGRVHLSACAKSCGAPAGVRHLVADETGAFR